MMVSDIIYKRMYGQEQAGIQIQYYTNGGEYLPPHSHPVLEIHYALEGCGEIIFDGSSHTFAAGEWMLVDFGAIHQTRCLEMAQGLLVEVSEDFLKGFVPQLDTLRLSLEGAFETAQRAEAYQKIGRLLGELPGLFKTRPRGYELRCEAVIMEVLFLLVGHFACERVAAKDADDGDVRNQERLQEILAYIREHYRENISLEEISGRFGLSREYFCRLFKKQAGVTFIQQLHLVRLWHIHADILNTQDSIMDIALKHGFTNYKLFTKMFREIYGCNPGKLR